MSTWLYPPAFHETFACDHCGEHFDEDDLTQQSPDYWTCKPCLEALIADAEKWAEDEPDYLEAAE